MQKHSWFEFEVSRVLKLAQNVPCLLVKAKKNGLLRHQVKVYRRSLHVVSKESLKGPCSVHI
jgi:hypothetical protein